MARKDLDIALDPEGRPYDVEADWWRNVSTDTRSVGDFQVIDGDLRVMDGNSIDVDPHFFRDEAQAVDFGPEELLDLSIVWEQGMHEGEQWEQVLGVRLDVPGTVVARWQPFELAYGTSGGVGGLISGPLIEQPVVGDDDLFLDIGYEGDYWLRDVDGDGFDDTLVFGNGSGDGGFPMTRGVDADDRLVALMVWDPRYPWRRAVKDGSPPQDVTDREDELLACLEGRRPTDEYGCPHGEKEGW